MTHCTPALLPYVSGSYLHCSDIVRNGPSIGRPHDDVLISFPRMSINPDMLVADYSSAI